MEAYQILGLGPRATAGEAKAAYRRLALQLHPDRHRTAGEREYYGRKFKLVRDAYELLRRHDFPELPQEPFPGPEYGALTAGRSFSPKEPAQAPLIDKLGLRSSWGLGLLLAWGVLLPGAALILFLFIRFLILEANR